MKWVAINKETKLVEMVGTTSTHTENTTYPDGYDIVLNVVEDIKPNLFFYRNDKFIEKTEQEKQTELFENRKNRMPSLRKDMLDSEITDAINDFYYNNIDADVFKKEKYYEIRKIFYPKYAEFVDSYVKMSSDDPDIKKEGQDQMKDYIDKCNAVKQRFPKE